MDPFILKKDVKKARNLKRFIKLRKFTSGNMRVDAYHERLMYSFTSRNGILFPFFFFRFFYTFHDIIFLFHLTQKFNERVREKKKVWQKKENSSGNGGSNLPVGQETQLRKKRRPSLPSYATLFFSLRYSNRRFLSLFFFITGMMVFWKFKCKTFDHTDGFKSFVKLNPVIFKYDY